MRKLSAVFSPHTCQTLSFWSNLMIPAISATWLGIGHHLPLSCEIHVLFLRLHPALPLPLSCHLSRAQVLCRGLWKSSAIMLWYSTRVPCVCVSACVCSHVHVCASVCACVCACVRASMFLTFWLLSQSICPTKSQGPAREPHVGGALPTPQEQAPPQT